MRRRQPTISMIQCLEIGSLSDYCFFLWMSKASWGNQHGITQDNMPCSVYRWQLRLRAHNMRERAVSYTASDAAGRSVFFQIWKFLVDFPIQNGDFPFIGVAKKKMDPPHPPQQPQRQEVNGCWSMMEHAFQFQTISETTESQSCTKDPEDNAPRLRRHGRGG